MYGLTPKETIELRLKCLEPFVTIASKHNIEQDTILLKAEKAWEYATQPLKDESNATSAKPAAASRKT